MMSEVTDIQSGVKIAVSENDEVETHLPEPHIRIVRPEGADAYDAYTQVVIPGGGVVTLAGDDTERRTMTVVNTTANRNVVIGHRSQVSGGNGFILLPNVPQAFTTVRELCANVPFGTQDTDARYVSVLVERNKV